MSDEIYDSKAYDDDRHVIASEPETNKKGSVWKGIFFALIATVILEFLVGQTLNTRENLVDRYIAYMLGILTLFILAYFTKSVWKMAFLGTPVVVAASFALPFLSPDNFSGLMSPFVNIVDVIQDLITDLKAIETNQNAQGTDSSGTKDLITGATLVVQYGALVDLIFAMVVGTFAGIGIVGFVKLFTNKLGILSIFTFLFSMFFFILGVIILPYLLVVTSGITQFGLVLAGGGLNMAEGFAVINDPDGDIADAQVFFDKATEWFEQADGILQGIEALKLFDLLSGALPDFKVLIDNLLILIDAAVNLVKGVSPMFIGVSLLESGIGKAMGVLTLGGGLALNQLSNEDIQTFNEGLDEMSDGFVEIKKAIPAIKEAITIIGTFNRAETEQKAKDNGADIGEQLDLIDGGISLVNAALDVFDTLITPRDDTVEAPLIHLLRGVLALSEAGDKVGGSSSFDGTTGLFDDVTGNLTLVLEIFDPNDPRSQTFDNFAAAEVGDVKELIEVKEQILGIFEFVEQSGNIAIELGQFGDSASVALGKMNTTLQIFEGVAFDEISPAAYQAAILNFTEADVGIIDLAETMMFDGIQVDSSVAAMKAKIASDDSAFGLMQDPAKEFVTVFEEFGLGQNGANFFSLAKGFTSLLRTTQELQGLDRVVGNIEGNVTIVQGLNLTADFLLIPGIFQNINGSLDEADTILVSSNSQITQAIANFSESIVATDVNGSVFATYDSLTVSMPQMADTTTAFTNIQTDIQDIQAELAIIQDLMIVDLSNPLNTFPNQAALDARSVALSVSLDNIGVELGQINDELKNVAIAS